MHPWQQHQRIGALHWVCLTLGTHTMCHMPESADLP